MITEVVKGVDDEIELKGFKGRYLYMLGGVVLGVIVLTFILYAIGFSSFWLMGLGLALCAGAYFYVKNEMEKHGKYGHIHSQHKAPKFLTLNTAFHKLIKNETNKN